MMILASMTLYPLIGYLVFRQWLRLSPPVNGKYNWAGGDYPGNTANGWYIPALWVSDKPTYGRSIEWVLWMSLFLWPVLVIAFVCQSGFDAITQIGRAITASIVTPKQVDKMLAEATKEVDKMLEEEA